jgi:hypothetical protein
MLQDQAVARETRRYERWLADLDAFDVEVLVLDIKRDGGLVQAARLHPGWDVDLEDGDAVLFARAGTSSNVRGAAWTEGSVDNALRGKRWPKPSWS